MPKCISMRQRTVISRAGHIRLACSYLRAGALVFALVVMAGAVAFAETLRCSVCHRVIKGEYLKANGRVFCSNVCFEKSLPKCPVCGRRVKGAHPVADGVHYCSDKCYEATLPQCEICGRHIRRGMEINGHMYCEEHSKLPRCAHCGLPSARSFKLEDGRHLCRKCVDDVVFDFAEAEKLYRQAQLEVLKATRLRSPTLPRLELAWMTDIRKRLSYDTDSGMVQRGLYTRTVTTTQRTNLFGRVLEEKKDVDETVYLLYGMSPEKVLVTAGHELTHDLIAEEFPEIRDDAPLWVEEGICQYVAALICRQKGYGEILEDIESCPDSVYGDGYRYVKRHAGANNWPALVYWIRTNDLSQLPKRAPKSAR
jgi:hypothetical protein